MKKLLFIFNPHTGGGRLKNKIMEILCLFTKHGYELSVWPTQKMGDARRIAEKRGSRADLLVCCGGDGTLNEVVDGIKDLEKKPLLGYIPGGTTCDFASSLGLPKTDMMAAARRIMEPKSVFECDTGIFMDRAFTYVAAFGAFTDVSYKTQQKNKNALGHFAYVLGAMQQLPNLESHHTKVICDGEVLEENILLGMVTNSVSVGGFNFPKANRVQLNDGKLEVLLVRQPRGLSELGELSTSILAGPTSSPLLKQVQARDIQFFFDSEVPWTLDGEFGGNHKDVTIGIRDKMISVCI